MWTSATTDAEAARGVPSVTEETRAMIEQQFRSGWDVKRVERLLAESDDRTEEAWVAAGEAAAADQDD